MKKISLLIMMSILLIGLATVVYSLAAVTLRSPANDDVINGPGQTLINITYTGEEASVFCQLRVTSVSTANNTDYAIFNLTNVTSAGLTQVNTTLNFSSVNRKLEDSNDYLFNATCQNTTLTLGTSVSDTSTGIVIDYDVPATPTISTLSMGSEVKDADTITYNVNGSQTTSCTILFNEIGYTATHSGGTCTYVLARTTIPAGSYNVVMRASDGTNTTRSVGTSLNMAGKQKNQNVITGTQNIPVTTTQAQSITEAAGSGGINQNQFMWIALGILAFFVLPKLKL